MICDYHLIATLPPTELLRNRYKIPRYFIKRKEFSSFAENFASIDPL